MYDDKLEIESFLSLPKVFADIYSQAYAKDKYHLKIAPFTISEHDTAVHEPIAYHQSRHQAFSCIQTPIMIH
jgi:hypothetical protein